MPWFKVDDSFESHPKVKSIPKRQRLRAIGLWTLAGSWCARQLMDGKVPSYMLAEFCSTKADAQLLVAAELWSVIPEGYLFNDWMDWQPTKAKVTEERDAAKERMRVARERKKQGGSGNVRPNESATPPNRSGEVRSTQRSVTPTRPDPTRPDPTEESADADREPGATLALVVDEPNAGTLIGEWLEHCEDRPPGRVIGQVSKELKTMLDEGIDPQRVRYALAEWNRKGLHPSALASVVHEVANRRPTPKRGDIDWDAAIARAAAKTEGAQP